MLYVFRVLLYFYSSGANKPQNEKEDGLVYSENEIKCLITDFKNALITSQRNSKKHEQFLDTFVYLPEKNKQLEYRNEMLAIDFGGSYLKLGLYCVKESNVEICGDKKVTKIFIPKNDAKLKQVDCFSWIAEEVKKYFNRLKINRSMYAGMAFSHPVEHKSINSGKLLKLGKNFPFKEFDQSKENDPVELINAAFKQLKVPVKVEVLLNDATATAASLIFGKNSDKEVTVGVVLGTGTNAAYVERHNRDNPAIINTEWASFDRKTLLKCVHDETIEKRIKDEKKVYKKVDALAGGNYFFELMMLILKDQFDGKKMVVLEEGKSFKLDANEKSPIVDQESENAAKEETCDESIINMDRVLDLVRKYAECPKDISDDGQKIVNTYKKLKKRSATIIMSLLAAIINSQVTKTDEIRVNVAINGSQFDVEEDMVIFYEELNKICNISKIKYENVNFIHMDDATLTGTIKVLAYEILRKSVFRRFLDTFF